MRSLVMHRRVLVIGVSVVGIAYFACKPKQDHSSTSPCAGHLDFSSDDAKTRAFLPANVNQLSPLTLTNTRSDISDLPPKYEFVYTRPDAVQLVLPQSGHDFSFISGKAGLATITAKLTTSDGVDSVQIPIDVPELAVIVAEPNFEAMLMQVYRFSPSQLNLALDTMRSVANYLVGEGNVKVIWQYRYNDSLPAQYTGGFADGKFIKVTLHDAMNDVPCEGIPGDTSITAWSWDQEQGPLADGRVSMCLSTTFSRSDPNAAPLYSQLDALSPSEYAKFWGRLFGRVLAHEIFRNVVGCSGLPMQCNDTDGLLAVAPSLKEETGFDCEHGTDTFDGGIEIEDPSKPCVTGGHMQDFGMGTIAHLSPTARGIVDSVLPVPPTFPEFTQCVTSMVSPEPCTPTQIVCTPPPIMATDPPEGCSVVKCVSDCCIAVASCSPLGGCVGNSPSYDVPACPALFDAATTFGAAIRSTTDHDAAERSLFLAFVSPFCFARNSEMTVADVGRRHRWGSSTNGRQCPAWA